MRTLSILFLSQFISISLMAGQPVDGFWKYGDATLFEVRNGQFQMVEEKTFSYPSEELQYRGSIHYGPEGLTGVSELSENSTFEFSVLGENKNKGELVTSEFGKKNVLSLVRVKDDVIRKVWSKKEEIEKILIGKWNLLSYSEASLIGGKRVTKTFTGEAISSLENTKELVPRSLNFSQESGAIISSSHQGVFSITIEGDDKVIVSLPMDSDNRGLPKSTDLELEDIGNSQFQLKKRVGRKVEVYQFKRSEL